VKQGGNAGATQTTPLLFQRLDFGISSVVGATGKSGEFGTSRMNWKSWKNCVAPMIHVIRTNCGNP
jgi:hypothetical protein